MKTYIIDTNALISFITDRNIAQQEIIAGIFTNTTRLKEIVLCPQNVLTEYFRIIWELIPMESAIYVPIIPHNLRRACFAFNSPWTSLISPGLLSMALTQFTRSF